MSDSKSETEEQHIEYIPTPAPVEQDVAAQILKDAGPVEVSEEDNRRILRKIDSRVLVALVIVYVLQQLDKSSVGYTSVFGIVADTHLVGTQYSWLSSCVYVAQLVFQPISSYAIVSNPAPSLTPIHVAPPL